MIEAAKYTVLIISVVLASGCNNIGSIGDKPEEQYQTYDLENPESSLSVVVGVDLDEIEEVIAKKFSSPTGVIV